MLSIFASFFLSLGHTLWLDPFVKRQHLKESNVVVDNFAVHEELMDMKLAMKNPLVNF